MDEHGQGWVSFKQLACALSTVFRGDKDDILDFWFRMYDTDKDGFLTRQVCWCVLGWGRGVYRGYEGEVVRCGQGGLD
jgi:Ca2+-binding EF-hand superfamily protein